MVTTSYYLDPAQAKLYVLAGDALFTVTNDATGKSFTYQVERWSKAKKRPGETPEQVAAREKKDETRPWSVKVLSGPDNTQDYKRVGTIMPPRPGFTEPARFFWNGSKANREAGKPVMAGAPLSAVGFLWTFERIMRGVLPSNVKLAHHGFCGRCGKLLTNDTNFALQEEHGWLYGPECRKLLGLPSTATSKRRKTPAPTQAATTPNPVSVTTESKSVAATGASSPAKPEEREEGSPARPERALVSVPTWIEKPCCDQAKRVFCVCRQATLCPNHGQVCVGSHD